MKQPQQQQPQLKVQPLYSTMNSIADVESYAASCLPIQTVNELHNILRVHQNTILTTLLRSKKA